MTSASGTVKQTYRREKTLTEAQNDLLSQLRMLGASRIVVSSNMKLRLDGTIRGGQPEPRDPGIAVYFRYEGQQRCFACDRWDRVADNIYAVAKTVEALRGIARWGSGEMVRAAFSGFRALPLPQRPWRQVFGFSEDERPPIGEIERRHREQAVKIHPDVGGFEVLMAEVNAARDEARRELGA